MRFRLVLFILGEFCAEVEDVLVPVVLIASCPDCAASLVPVVVVRIRARVRGLVHIGDVWLVAIGVFPLVIVQEVLLPGDVWYWQSSLGSKA